MTRTVSVIINTCDRAASLADTLAALPALNSLAQERPVALEVVVVSGPATDGTEAVLAGWRGAIKVGRCPVRNLSRSRNIGIRLAAGEVVAFIDDDAIPDPGWLADLLPLFDDPATGGAGGPVFDHTGVRLQAHYLVCDRFGGAELTFDRDPGPLLNIPLGARYCATLGTNALFRRAALVEIGGFDEEYEYYLDETDVCLRLVDAGWMVRFGARGQVHHRSLASSVRTAARVVADWYPVLKNKAYFAARHGAPVFGVAAACAALDAFAAQARRDTEAHVAEGTLPGAALPALEAAVIPATLQGFRRAAQPAVSSLTPRRAGPDAPWRPFPLRPPPPQDGRRLHLCYATQDFPPGVVAGIARVTHALATGMAERGHIVRVLTRARDGRHQVDWVDGLWVHAVPDAAGAAPAGNPGLPDPLWRRSAAVLRELVRIASWRAVDLVQAPNWDCEGLATILDGRFPTVLGLYTPMTAALEHNPAWAADVAFRRETVDPLIAGERLCYARADACLACGATIVGRIEDDYGVTLRDRLLGLVPHGLPDRGDAPPPAGPGVEILFVGRLEHRKGIDVLLRAVPLVCAARPEARFVIAGDDAGLPWRECFLGDPASPPWRDRVRFAGSVSDEVLDALYRSCDIVVVPSRFELFGLPLIEAMMRGRPVVASLVGGMADIVEPGRNGLLVPAGDPAALAAALQRLIGSADERHAFGRRSRELFVERYERGRMIEGAARFYRDVVRRPADRAEGAVARVVA